MAEPFSVRLARCSIPTEAWKALALGLLQRTERRERRTVTAIERRFAWLFDYYEVCAPKRFRLPHFFTFLPEDPGRRRAVEMYARQEMDALPGWIADFKPKKGGSISTLEIPNRWLPLAHRWITCLVKTMRKLWEEERGKAIACLAGYFGDHGTKSQSVQELSARSRELRTQIGESEKRFWEAVLRLAVFPCWGLGEPAGGTLKTMTDAILRKRRRPQGVATELLTIISRGKCGDPGGGDEDYTRQETSRNRSKETRILEQFIEAFFVGFFLEIDDTARLLSKPDRA